MQIYDIVADNNKILRTLTAEVEAIDPSNRLERNIVFERLKNTLLEDVEVKERTFYATLSLYVPTQEIIDQWRHRILQLSGLMDALTRESINTTSWSEDFSIFKRRLEDTIAFEEEKALPLAKCYFTPADQEQLLQSMGTEERFLGKNRRIEEAAEKAFETAYQEEKKALDTPGKSHLPPKRRRMA